MNQNLEFQQWANKIGEVHRRITEENKIPMESQKIDLDTELAELNKTAIQLIGKTITSSKICRLNDYIDDIPYLILGFSDGTEYVAYAYYGGYTGNSADEYPAMICISKSE